MNAPITITICLLAILMFIVGCKPTLTQSNAEKLIRNGMSEAEVSEMLGTNCSVMIGPRGEKRVLFNFESTGPSQRFNTKIDSIGIIFSNGVVIGKRFPAKW